MSQNNQSDQLTRKESLDIQHLLHFTDLNSPVTGHSLPPKREKELRDRLVEVTGVDIRDEYPELFPDKNE